MLMSKNIILDSHQSESFDQCRQKNCDIQLKLESGNVTEKHNVQKLTEFWNKQIISQTLSTLKLQKNYGLSENKYSKVESFNKFNRYSNINEYNYKHGFVYECHKSSNFIQNSNMESEKFEKSKRISSKNKSYFDTKDLRDRQTVNNPKMSKESLCTKEFKKLKIPLNNTYSDASLTIGFNENRRTDELKQSPKNKCQRNNSKKNWSKTSFKANKTMSKKIFIGIENEVLLLTHKFNQINNKDHAILEELRKNGNICLKTRAYEFKKKDIGKDNFDSQYLKTKINAKKSIDEKSVDAIDNLDTLNKFDEGVIENQTLKSPIKPSISEKSEKMIFQSLGIKNKSCIKSVPLQNEFNEFVNITINLMNDEKIHNIKSLETSKENTLNRKHVVFEKNTFKHHYNDDLSKLENSEPKEINLNKEQNQNTQETHFPSTLSEITNILKPSNQNNCHKNGMKSNTNNIGEISASSEQKILDAIETVNHKIDVLSRSENYFTFCNVELEPNVSFVFRSNSRNSFENSVSICTNQKIIQAVNSSLINKTQSMDGNNFPLNTECLFAYHPVNNKEGKEKRIFNENNYEFQKSDYDTNVVLEEIYETKSLRNDYYKEDDYETISLKSWTVNEALENHITAVNMFEKPFKTSTDELLHDLSVDSNTIYQSIDEVIDQKQISILDISSDKSSETSYESYDSNYEIVFDKKKSYEGHEFEKSSMNAPDPPPPRSNIKSISSVHELTPSLPVPKITDECLNDNSAESFESLNIKNDLLNWEYSDSMSTLSSDQKTNSIYGIMEKHIISSINDSCEGSNDGRNITDEKNMQKNHSTM